MEPTIGRTIHVNDANVLHRGDNKICLAGVIGGFLGKNFWVTLFQFTGPRVTWIYKETEWHDPRECTNVNDGND